MIELAAGVFPAQRAAGLNPVQALRKEPLLDQWQLTLMPAGIRCRCYMRQADVKQPTAQ